jgi:hypothetical protein
VKPTLVALAGTVTMDGTVTAALPLEMFTENPPIGAFALSVTVQGSVPVPDMDALMQDRPLSAEVIEPAVAPFPWSLTVVVQVLDLLLAKLVVLVATLPVVLGEGWLVMVNCAWVSELPVGSKWTIIFNVSPAARVRGRFPSPSAEKELLEKVS